MSFSRRSLLMSAVALIVSSAVASAEDRMPVVASFSILGDFVRVVGGDRITLTTLVGADGDAHVYQPSPADAKACAAAKVLFVNGFAFEGWFDRLFTASGSKGTIVVATAGIQQRKMAGEDDAHGIDPHAWQSVRNAKVYVANDLAVIGRDAGDR